MSESIVITEGFIRDVFAAVAMHGLCGCMQWKPSLMVHEDQLARDAYAIADEMMKARKDEEA